MTAIATPRHLVSVATAHVHDELDAVADASVWSMDAAETAAAWLAHQTRTTRAEAHRVVRLGHDLDAHPATRTALVEGTVVADQARVILRWVDDLPDTLATAQIQAAERHLLKQAREHDAKALNRLGRRLFEVIAPDEADAREAATLAKEEAAAARACHLAMVDDGHGAPTAGSPCPPCTPPHSARCSPRSPPPNT